MRRAWHVAAAVVLTAAVSAGTAGCGVVDDLRTTGFARQSGAEIVTAASNAMADVTSMRVTGQTRMDGNPIFLDLTLGEDSCTGTLRFEKSRMSLLRIGDRAWFKGDRASYARLSGTPMPGGAAAGSSTSWVRDDDLADDEMCDLAGHLAAFSLQPDTTGAKDAKGRADGSEREWTDLEDLAVGEEVEVDGGRAVPVTSTPTDTAWISSQDPHHVVRLERTVPRDGGWLSYAEFDRDVVIEAPKGADVLRP